MPSFDDMANMMPGVFLAYQRLAWLVAKYCNVLNDLHLEPLLGDFSYQPLEPPKQGKRIRPETLDHLEKTISQSPTELAKFLEQYFKLRSTERHPDLLGEEGRAKIAEYCLDIEQHPSAVLMRAFGSWVHLLKAIQNESFLRRQCNPTRTATFGQLADQVYRALGFAEEERAIGLVQVTKEARQTRERWRSIGEREAWGLGTPIFNAAEDILVGLVSFHCRALDTLGSEYRSHLSGLLREAGGAGHRNYQSEKLQFGNKIDLIAQADRLIWDERAPERLVEFQRKFGPARAGIIDLTMWREILQRVAIVRGATAHPEIVVSVEDLEEFQGVLTGGQRRYFERDKLEYHQNEFGAWVIRFDLRQLKILLWHALEWLCSFYKYLEDIYPDVQLHDQVEIRRDGSSWLLYTDEDGNSNHMSLGEERNFNGIFFPGQRVFFKHLYDGTRKWIPIREQ